MYNVIIPALDATEKSRLRAGGHKADLKLSVMKPTTLLAARVNDAGIERGDRAIVYDTGTESGFATIEAGHTLWVGSSASSYDKGRVRIKSITGSQSSGTITVAENAIDWSNNDYLTVRYVYELWSVYPFIDDDGNFYKDFDVSYTDENEEPPPVVIIGPAWAGTRTGATLSFDLYGSASYAVASGASASSIAFACATAQSISPAGWNATITFDADGLHWLKVTVTDSNGKTQDSYRPIFVHSATGADAPYKDFALESLTGNWQSGGWSASFRVFGDATGSDFPDGTMVVLWHEASYAGVEDYIGGVSHGGATQHGQLLFVGYVRGESVKQDSETGDISFDASTMDGLLRRQMMFSISLQTARDPTKWYEYLKPLTVMRAIHHVWRWHSTLFQIADVILPTTNALQLKYSDDFIRSDLYSQVNNFSFMHSIMAHVCCNKIGQVFVEEDIQMLDSTGRGAITTVCDITGTDRRDEIVIDRKPEKTVCEVHLSGFNFDGSTATPIIAKAPGEVPEEMGGQVSSHERQVLDDQAQANEIAGRVLAVANDPIKDVRIKFGGHYLCALDVVPQGWWTLTLEAGDTPRGLVWTDQKLVPRSVTGMYDPEGGIILADAILQREATGPDGITGDYPTEPPDDPPDPEPPDDPPPVVLNTGALLAFDSAEGCWYRPPGASDWVERNASLTGSDDNDLQGGWDPWWHTPSKQGTSNPAYAILFRCQVGKIYRSVDCGKTWEDVTPTTDPPNSWGDAVAPTVATVSYVQRLDSIHQNGLHIFLVEWQNATSEWRSWLLKTEDDCLSWSWAMSGTAQVNNVFGDGSYSNSGCSLGGNFSDMDDVDDETFWGVDTNGAATYVEITPPSSIVAGQVISIRGQKSGGITGYLFLREWNGSAWVETSRAVSPAGWAWRYPVAQYSHTSIRLQRKASDFFNVEWDLDCMYISAEEQNPDTRVLWGDIDSEDGDRLWLTSWRGGILYLEDWDVSAFTRSNSYEIGAATQSEMEAWTYIAFPVTPLGDKDTCYVFGRMDNPQSLGGTQHVITTDDAGSSFSSVESGWGSNYCSAMQVAADGTMTAIRSGSAGAASVLYRGSGSLGYVSTLPFGNNVNVYVDALTTSGTGDIAVAAYSAATYMIIFAQSPYTTWGDITDSFPGSGVSSLAYL